MWRVRTDCRRLPQNDLLLEDDTLKQALEKGDPSCSTFQSCSFLKDEEVFSVSEDLAKGVLAGFALSDLFRLDVAQSGLEPCDCVHGGGICRAS